MKKSSLATLAVLISWMVCLPQTAHADPLNVAEYFSFLSAAERQTLLTKNELTATGSSIRALPWGLRGPMADEVRAGMTIQGASVAIEGFFLVPRPAGDVHLALYNAVNAVASMEGLEYYSVSRKRMEPLILASWRVASLERPAKIPDPTFSSIPGFQKAVVFQKDNKLGDGYSEVTWKSLDQGILVITFRNLQPLNYGILPLVDPGNLQMLFVVVPLADRVAVYGVMEAKTAQLFGLERSKDESFRNRMRALAGWLGSRITSIK